MPGLSVGHFFVPSLRGVVSVSFAEDGMCQRNRTTTHPIDSANAQSIPEPLPNSLGWEQWWIRIRQGVCLK